MCVGKHALSFWVPRLPFNRAQSSRFNFLRLFFFPIYKINVSAFTDNYESCPKYNRYMHERVSGNGFEPMTEVKKKFDICFDEMLVNQ